jgi:hypothetical protein
MFKVTTHLSLILRLKIRGAILPIVGQDSSVGIVTGYGPDGQGSNPGGGTHIQTGPGAHPTPCTMGTRSFPGVKRPERGADHPPPSSAEVTNE